MAEPPEHENMAGAVPQGAAQGQPKKLTGLESIVDETSHAIGSAVKLGLAAAVPYTFANTFPSLKTDTAVLTGAQIVSDYTTSLQRGKKYTAGNILESAAIGTAITWPLETMFNTVNKMPLNTPLDYIAKAGAWGGIAYPAFNALYLPVAYLIRNRTFKGIGKDFKEKYWPILKKSWKYILPFSLLNVFLSPAALQIPIAAALSFVYDRFTAPKGEVPDDQKREKGSYAASAVSVTAKLARNLVYYPFRALYDVGKALGGNGGSSAPASPVPPRATPAPSH